MFTVVETPMFLRYAADVWDNDDEREARTENLSKAFIAELRKLLE